MSAQSLCAAGFGDPLIDAADAGDVARVKAFVQAGRPVDREGEFGTTALMRAALKGDEAVVAVLLAAGANPAIKDIGGETPLHLAARKGYAGVARQLLRAGAPVDAKDNEGWTALMRAVVGGNADMVSTCIAAGADPAIRNQKSESAAMMAEKSGNASLQKAMAFNVPDHVPVVAATAFSRGVEGTALEALPDKPDSTAKAELVKTFIPSASPEINMASDRAAPRTEDATPPPVPVLKPHDPSRSLFSGEPKTALLPWQVAKKPSPGMSYPAVWVPLAPVETSFAAPAARLISASAPSTSAAASVAPSTVYVVQLGVFEGKKQASDAWYRLQGKYEDILAEVTPVIKKITVMEGQGSARQIFKLRAGSFSERAKAQRLCQALNNRREVCFVVDKTREPAPVQHPVPVVASPVIKQPEVPAPVASVSPARIASVDTPPPLALKPAETPQSLLPASQNISTTAQDTAPLPWLQAVSNSNQTVPEPAPAAIAAQTPVPFPPSAGTDVHPVISHAEMSQIPLNDFEEEYQHFNRSLEEKGAPLHASVSEAVMVNGEPPAVPAPAYFEQTDAAMSGGMQVTLSGFKNKAMAEDYYERMFHYNEALKQVQMTVVSEKGLLSSVVKLQLSRLPAEQVAHICDLAKKNGLACAYPEKNDTTPAQLKRRPANPGRQADIAPGAADAKQPKGIWIQLGTFATRSEADYYWMLLQEDHADVMHSLDHTLMPVSHGAFGHQAVELMAGSFTTYQEAVQTCKTLSAQKIACALADNTISSSKLNQGVQGE